MATIDEHKAYDAQRDAATKKKSLEDAADKFQEATSNDTFAFGKGLVDIATKGLKAKPEELAAITINCAINLGKVFVDSVRQVKTEHDLAVHIRNNMTPKKAEATTSSAPSVEAEGSGASATGGGSGQTGRRSFASLGNDSIAAGPSFL